MVVPDALEAVPDVSTVVLELASAVPVYEQARDGVGRFAGFQVSFAPVVVRQDVFQRLVAGRPYRLVFRLVEE